MLLPYTEWRKNTPRIYTYIYIYIYVYMHTYVYIYVHNIYSYTYMYTKWFIFILLSFIDRMQACCFHILSDAKIPLDHISLFSPFFEINGTWDNENIAKKYTDNHELLGGLYIHICIYYRYAYICTYEYVWRYVYIYISVYMHR
jgi:hypothetical protein